MKRDIIYKNWLYHVPGIGRVKYSALLKMAGSAGALYEMSKEEARRLLAEEKAAGWATGVSAADLERVDTFKKKALPERLWQRLKEQGIRVLDEDEEAYPERLLDIPDRPMMLYETGTSFGSAPSLAVIGSRICSEYGRMIAMRTGRLCAELGIELISGMAVGIDGIAQRGAVENGGMVTAVLGSGADVCYPKENRDLYNKLVSSGRILSEYIPGTRPVPGNFPPRNRIISGLADAVLVVEAKEKSGTMITVDMALEQGRQVYIIPGRLTDPLSAGCNRLIAQGADIVWNLGEVLEGIAKGGRGSALAGASGESAEVLFENPFSGDKALVWEALDYVPQSPQQIYEKLCEKSEMPFSGLQQILLDLELSGYVTTCGSRFSKKGG